VSYLAYLCYRKSYDDDEDVIIKFEQPASWQYEKVVAIEFSPLQSWTSKDKELC